MLVIHLHSIFLRARQGDAVQKNFSFRKCVIYKGVPTMTCIFHFYEWYVMCLLKFKVLLHSSLCRYKLAYNDYQLALSIDRTLTVAYQATSRITRLLREMEGNEWREKLPPNPDAARVREELQRMARSFSGELRNHDNSTADGQFADSSTAEDQGGIQFTANDDSTTESEGQRSPDPVTTSDFPPPMDSINAESAQDNEYSPGSIQDNETSYVDYDPQDNKDTSLPESVSSDSVGTDTSTYDTSNSIDESSEGTESTTPLTPPIDITTTAPGSSETKV